MTEKACSCPAHNWHPNQICKHQRKYFPEQQTAKPAATAIKQPNSGTWHGHNVPVLDEERPAMVSSSPSFVMVDTLPDVSNRDIAYHNIQADRDLWPCEA